MSKSDLRKLGKNIQKYRRIAALSQEKLAELIDKSRNAVGMIERAEVDTHASTLFKIAKALDINMQELFDFK